MPPEPNIINTNLSKQFLDELGYRWPTAKERLLRDETLRKLRNQEITLQHTALAKASTPSLSQKEQPTRHAFYTYALEKTVAPLIENNFSELIQGPNKNIENIADDISTKIFSKIEVVNNNLSQDFTKQGKLQPKINSVSFQIQTGMKIAIMFSVIVLKAIAAKIPETLDPLQLNKILKSGARLVNEFASIPLELIYDFLFSIGNQITNHKQVIYDLLFMNANKNQAKHSYDLYEPKLDLFQLEANQIGLIKLAFKQITEKIKKELASKAPSNNGFAVAGEQPKPAVFGCPAKYVTIRVPGYKPTNLINAIYYLIANRTFPQAQVLKQQAI